MASIDQAERGQAQAPPTVQGNVVQGVPVGMGPTPMGVPCSQSAPMAAVGPLGIHGAGLPTRVAIVPDLPEQELIALSLRHSVICFAIIDFVFTAIGVASLIMVPMVSESYEKETEEYRKNYIWYWAVQLVFLLGAVCGIAGARTLKRGLVTVYLGFCLASSLYSMAVAVLTWSLWFIFIAFIHAWITKIVCRFWSALGAIPADRIAQMRDPDYLEKAPVTMIYW